MTLPSPLSSGREGITTSAFHGAKGCVVAQAREYRNSRPATLERTATR
jgi:hypothetical protein